MKEEWKCALMEDGEQCAMIPGVLKMLKLCADSWDFHSLVHVQTTNHSYKATPSGSLVSGQGIPPVYRWAGGFYHYSIIAVPPKKCHDADGSRSVI